MADSNNQTQSKSSTENSTLETKKPGYWERVIYGKGTVAEDWPTGKQLWNNPQVQKAIKAHNALVRKRSNS